MFFKRILKCPGLRYVPSRSLAGSCMLPNIVKGYYCKHQEVYYQTKLTLNLRGIPLYLKATIVCHAPKSDTYKECEIKISLSDLDISLGKIIGMYKSFTGVFNSCETVLINERHV